MSYVMFTDCRLTQFARLAALGLLIVTAAFTHNVLGDDDAPGVVSATAASSADGSIRLIYKFQAGQFSHYSGTSRVQYITQLESKKFTTLQTNDTGTHFRVITVDESGNALIEPVVDRTRMTAKMPDKDPVVFDSESGEPVPVEFRTIREAIGRPVARFTVSPYGELIKATVIDPTAPQSLRDGAEKLTTRFAFVVRLPKTAVRVGDKWKEDYSTTVSIGRGLRQDVMIRRVYELVSVSDGVAHIKFKTTLLKSLQDPELEKQVIQQTPHGSIDFDIERGLVRTHVSNINQTTINAFGAQSLLQVVGEATETLVTAAADAPRTANRPSTGQSE